jgi:hypothetical protein
MSLHVIVLRILCGHGDLGLDARCRLFMGGKARVGLSGELAGIFLVLQEMEFLYLPPSGDVSADLLLATLMRRELLQKNLTVMRTGEDVGPLRRGQELVYEDSPSSHSGQCATTEQLAKHRAHFDNFAVADLCIVELIYGPRHVLRVRQFHLCGTALPTVVLLKRNADNSTKCGERHPDLLLLPTARKAPNLNERSLWRRR